MSRIKVVDKVLCAFQILRTLSFVMRLIEAFPTNQILSEETSGTANWTNTFSRDFFNVVAVVFARVTLVVDGIRWGLHTIERIVSLRCRFQESNVHDIVHVPMRRRLQTVRKSSNPLKDRKRTCVALADLIFAEVGWYVVSSV